MLVARQALQQDLIPVEDDIAPGEQAAALERLDRRRHNPTPRLKRSQHGIPSLSLPQSESHRPRNHPRTHFVLMKSFENVARNETPGAREKAWLNNRDPVGRGVSPTYLRRTLRRAVVGHDYRRAASVRYCGIQIAFDRKPRDP